MEIQQYTTGDSWQSLKKFTAARIALGSTGVAIPLKEVLQFRLAHAYARDAVYSQLDQHVLAAGFQLLQLPFTVLHSKAQNRNEYLQQPDFGRQLNAVSAQQLQDNNAGCDIAIIIADGLSATAVNHHAMPVLQLLTPLLKQSGFSLAPVNIVQQARVAIGDEVGVLCKAKFFYRFNWRKAGLILSG